MESARPLTLFEILPKKDHHLIDGAVMRYRDERGVLGPVKAAQNFFALFPTLAGLTWSDSDVAFAEAQWELEIQKATDKPTSFLPIPLANPVKQPTNSLTTIQKSPVQPETSKGSTKSAQVQEHPMISQATCPRQQSATEAFSYLPSPSDSPPSVSTSPQKTPPAHNTIHGDGTHCQHDQVIAHKSSNPSSHPVPQRSNVPQRGIGPKEHVPTENYLERYHARSTPFHPSASQKVTAQNGNNSLQSHALHTPPPSPEPTTAGPATPLEIPYLGKMCEICGEDFVWKKTATRCFKCLQNPPSHQKIAEIFLRAMRGIDSCSNCYGEADRGDNMHCHDCHERQKLKTERHAAKVKARSARQAAEAPQTVLEGGGQQQVSQTHGVQTHGVPHHSAQHQNNQHHGLGHHGPQHQGLQRIRHRPTFPECSTAREGLINMATKHHWPERDK